MFSEVTIAIHVVCSLRERLAGAREDPEAGYSTEAVVVIALLVAVAVAAGVGLVLLTPMFMLSGRAHGGVEPFGGIGLPLLLDRSVVIPMFVVFAIFYAPVFLMKLRQAEDPKTLWRERREHHPRFGTTTVQCVRYLRGSDRRCSWSWGRR